MQMSAMSQSPLQIPHNSVPRSSSAPLQAQLHSGLSASSLSLGLLPLPPPASSHHRADYMINVEPLSAVHPLPEHSVPTTTPISPLPKINLSDITSYDGAPTPIYNKAVESLSSSLTRHNAAVIVVGSEEAALLRCTLESGRLYFRTRSQIGGNWSKPARPGIYMYRAGRSLEEGHSSPPCLGEAFRCMGNTSRVALRAIARHLRLRSDVFNHLLDDTPLPANEASSSVLVAAYSHTSSQNGKGVMGGVKPVTNSEFEKGLLTLVASDNPGLQVCDPNGRWYLADGGLGPGDLLLLTGRALSHATAGLRHAASYRAITDYWCRSYDWGQEVQNNINPEPSLRSVLSDPLSGAFLEDAMVVSCGHSFGGMMLRKVIDMNCSSPSSDGGNELMRPCAALRAAAAAVKHEDDRRLFHNSALRKRRKEGVLHVDSVKRLNKEDGEINADGENLGLKATQYPFSVNEKVIIKGNRRTPEKFVGREAVITSQCLNGWYLLKTLDNGESVRLQYRSLRKISKPQAEQQPQHVVQNGS